MSTSVIVMVSDNDNGKRGEITVADDPRSAERQVERLLEAGVERGQIRLFNGDQVEMRISSRPVVALTDSAAATAAEESPTVEVESKPEVVAWEAKEEATPYMKDGIRFSSLFRSADAADAKGDRSPALGGVR